jgi:replication factor A1
MADDVRNILDLDEKGEWVSLEVKVLKLWEPKSDAISQSGIVADETGEINFVSWKKSKLLKLEDGKSYIIRGAVVDSWNGNKQINFNSRTKISPIDKIIEASGSGPVEGIITGIIPKSGYIERCPECKRVLVNDHCPVHIDVKPKEDIRIKASLDSNSRIFVANGKLAEKLLGIQLEQARKIEEEDLNCLIEVKLVGKKYRFKGREFENNFIIEDFQKIEDQDD